jgi:hypothetical protein
MSNEGEKKHSLPSPSLSIVKKIKAHPLPLNNQKIN